MSDLEEAGLSFNPPTEAREKCEFIVQDDWKKTDDGFLAWEDPLHNTGGFEKKTDRSICVRRTSVLEAGVLQQHDDITVYEFWTSTDWVSK